LKEWIIDTCECLFTLEVGCEVYSLSKSKDNKRIACGLSDGRIEMRRMSDFGCWASFHFHSGAVYSLCTLEDGSFISGSGDRTMKRWSGEDGVVLQNFSGHRNAISRVIQLKSDVIVSASLNKVLKIWKVSSGECLHTLSLHSNLLYGLVKISDGLFASGAEDESLRVWNERGECIETIAIRALKPMAMTRLGDTIVVADKWHFEIRKLK